MLYYDDNVFSYSFMIWRHVVLLDALLVLMDKKPTLQAPPLLTVYETRGYRSVITVNVTLFHANLLHNVGGER